MRKQKYAIGGVAAFTMLAGILVAASASAGTTTYEAESAGNRLTGGAQVVSCERCSGGSRVTAVGLLGKLAITRVAAKRTGTTKIQVTYASTEDRVVQIRVNGGVPTAIDFPSTRGVGRTGTLRILLGLDAGDNTIEFDNPAGPAPDIDKIVITTDGPAPTAPPAVPASAAPGVTATASAPASQPAPEATGPAPSSPAAGDVRAKVALEAQVVSLVNAERATAGCRSLVVDARLTAAARSHSTDMAARDFLGHTGSDGAEFAARITGAGYKFSIAAENITKGQPTPREAMASWLGSPSHRANIVNCAYRNIGVGVTADKTGTLLWTQDFATPL